MTTATSLYPETAKDALAAWDAGDTVFTIEMGGLGPGYEQAIQLLIFELIRAQGDTPLPSSEEMKEQWSRWHDEMIHKLDEKNGFSGAQVGAAKHIAYIGMRDGWRKMLESMKSTDADRIIQVSNHWPQA